MSPLPAYQRIYDDIAVRIRSGDLKPEDRLLSETELAEQYGVARMTVRQAIGRLVTDNLVVRLHGVGTFVRKGNAARRSLNRLTGFGEDMRGIGRATETKILLQEAAEPTAEIVEALELDPGARVVHVGRLRIVDKIPTIIQDSWLPLGLCPSLARDPLVNGSLYQTLSQRYGVKLNRAEQHITAVAAGIEEAKLLGVPRRSPLLRIIRISRDERDIPVEYAQSLALPTLELSIHLES